MKQFARISTVIIAFAVGLHCRQATVCSADTEPLFEHAVVAADHSAASLAGIEILKKGGNVVDAAVATGFALSVVRPASCGIGGGGFMVIWDAEKKRGVALDYRERAPGCATRNMYVDPQDSKKVRPDASEHGHLAIAVPGHVAGLCFALREYGTLNLETVLAPAIRLCRAGVPVDKTDISIQKEVLQGFCQPSRISREICGALAAVRQQRRSVEGRRPVSLSAGKGAERHCETRGRRLLSWGSG